MTHELCSVENCDRFAVARGWCRPHYDLWREHGDPRGGAAVEADRIAAQADGHWRRIREWNALTADERARLHADERRAAWDERAENPTPALCLSGRQLVAFATEDGLPTKLVQDLRDAYAVKGGTQPQRVGMATEALLEWTPRLAARGAER